MTSFIKQKTATFSRPRIIVKYMDTLLTSKPLTTATPVDGYTIVDGDIVLFTNLSAINYTIHRATVTGVNITWTQLALGQSADGLPALGDEVFIQAGTYTKKIYWYDGVSFIEFKSGGGIGDSSIFGYLNSQDDNVTTQPFTTGNNATFLTAGTFIGSFNQKNETNPLNGKSSYTYTQGATSINDWIASYPITVPLKAKGVTNVTKLSYMYDGGNSDILPVVYDVTNSKILSSTTKYLENTNGVTKRCELVYDVPSTCSSIKIGFHVKVTNNEKILKFDDIETGVWTPQAVNLVEQESVTYTGYFTGKNPIVFLTRDSQISNERNLIEVSTVSLPVTASKYKILKPANFSVTSSVYYLSAGNYYISITHFDSANNVKKRSMFNPSTSLVSGVVAMSGKADVGDYFTVETNATPKNVTETFFSITASAISENVVQAWQDGMATWSATSTIQIGATTTAPTKGTTDLDQVKWIKRGESAEFWYQYSQTGAGSAGSGDYLFTLPNGMQFADHVIKYTTLEGVAGWTTGKVGINAGTGWNAGAANYVMFVFPYDNTRFRVAYIGASDASQTGSGVVGSGAAFNMAGSPISFSLKFTAPIAGWSSTPTLLALPTSKENVFSARIDTSGNIISKSSDWIQSVTQSGTGNNIKTITFKSGIFTVAPSITSMVEDASTSASVYVSSAAGLVTSTTAVLTVYNDAGAIPSTNHGITIIAQKQSPDYTAPGVFVGNVAKNQVAKVVYDTSGIRTTLSTNPVALAFNRVSGIHSNIVSLNNSQFTLQQGSYDLDWFAKHYVSSASTGIMRTYLFNVTDGVEVETGSQDYLQNVTGQYGMGISKGSCSIDIASTKTFEIRAVNLAGSTGSNFVGNEMSAPFSLKAEVKITKLNGQ